MYYCTAGQREASGIRLPALVIGGAVAGISGDAVGYSFGRRVGRRLFERPDSRFFKRRHLLAAEVFYEKYSGKAVVLARFMPIVRTFAPIVAGMAKSAIGALCASMPSVMCCGRAVCQFVSLLPMLIHPWCRTCGVSLDGAVNPPRCSLPL